ncbi:shieldin complex subunit 2-like isoform X2 [Hydractinia symbiolongicarpus]|nr:shieldin complex subunit 2-like isoform X2 [Hydractinia symbiolongicarpus]XP_057300641.1 shieldin complex subunit 2-like isoform X2 [Hydractinia symbiolongicarpus]
MKTLHIFAGAPKLSINNENTSVDASVIWKQYTFTTAELCNNTSMFSQKELSEILLEYEVNQSQLSNIVEPGCYDTMLPKTKSEDIKSLDRVDVNTDMLYQEVCIESQLLFKSDDCLNEVGPTIPRYSDYSQTYFMRQQSQLDAKQFSNSICEYEDQKNMENRNGKSVEPSVIPETQENEPMLEYQPQKGADSFKDKNFHSHPKSVLISNSDTMPLCVNKEPDCSCTTDEQLTSSLMHSSCDIPNSCSGRTIMSINNAIETKQMTNLLVIVLQICPVRIVQIKHCPNIGQKIKLAKLMVGDESKFYFNITLWNNCADWVDRIRIGDVIVLTNVMMQLYKGKYMGQSNATSKVFNFRRPVWPFPKIWSNVVCIKKLYSFIAWIRNTHNYLLSFSFHIDPTVVRSEFTELVAGHINNVCARIMTVNSPEVKQKYLFMGQDLSKVVVKLADKAGNMVDLFIWAEKYGWLTEFYPLINSVLIIKALLYKYNTRERDYSLHTTFKSSYQVVKEWKSADKFVHCLATIKSISLNTKSSSNICVTSSNVSSQLEDLLSFLFIGCSECYTELVENSDDSSGNCCNCENSEAVIGVHKFFMIMHKYHSVNQSWDADVDFQMDDSDVSDSFGVWVNPEVGKELFTTIVTMEQRLLHKNKDYVADKVMLALANLFDKENVYHVCLKSLESIHNECSLLSDEIYSLEEISKY